MKTLRKRFIGAILIPTTLLLIAMSFSVFNVYKQSNQLRLEIIGTQVQDILYNISYNTQSSQKLLNTNSWRNLPNISNKTDKNISEVQKILKVKYNKKLFKHLLIQDEADFILNDS